MRWTIRVFPFLTLVAVCVPCVLQAQRTRYGVAVGTSLAGGGATRTWVDAGGFAVTGAGGAGFHIRGMAERSISGGFSFRGELFYNQLTSGPNTYAIVGDTVAATALRDRTIGLTANFVTSLAPQAKVSPYVLVGAGMFLSSLGTNPDPQSDQVDRWVGSLGLGVQTGMGLRVRAGDRSVLLEWRFGQALNRTRGMAIMPLTVGITF